MPRESRQESEGRCRDNDDELMCVPNKDIGCHLNDLHTIENGIERLLRGGKPARSDGVLERESSLTFDW